MARTRPQAGDGRYTMRSATGLFASTCTSAAGRDVGGRELVLVYAVRSVDGIERSLSGPSCIACSGGWRFAAWCTARADRVATEPMEPGPESATTEPAAAKESVTSLSKMATREDFLATGDPALQEGVDRGSFQLLGYTSSCGLGSASSGRPRTSTSAGTGSTGTSGSRPRSATSACMGSPPSSPASRRSPMSSVRSCALDRPRRCEISSRPRSPTRRPRTYHFFERFYSEVGILEGVGDLAEHLRAVEKDLNDDFGQLFGGRDADPAGRPARRRARRHRDAGRGDHALPHGDRGNAGAHRPALHHRLRRGAGDAARASSMDSRRSPATSTVTSPSAPSS